MKLTFHREVIALKARIIYNPTAGRETFKKEIASVLEKLEKAGYETSAHATTGAGDAEREASRANDKGFDLILAVGGDGTINEVINGISAKEKRAKIGIIPAGTTNDFARALNIPRDINKAVDVIVDNHSMKLDVGKANDQYFVNIAGGGDLTELTYDVNSKSKAMVGQLAYYMKGIEMLPSIRPVNTTIEYDGTVFEGEIMLFLVGNTNSVGGFEKLAPDAKLNDGLFDLIILKKLNIAEFIRVATMAMRGAHLDHKDVIYMQAKKIKVIPDDKMQLNIDGEFGGLLPSTFENFQEHIEFFVPESFIEKQADPKLTLEE